MTACRACRCAVTVASRLLFLLVLPRGCLFSIYPLRCRQHAPWLSCAYKQSEARQGIILWTRGLSLSPLAK